MVKLFNEIAVWFNSFLSVIPGTIGVLVRNYYYRSRLSEGRKLFIDTGCRFIGYDNIFLGDQTSIGQRSFFSAENGVINCARGTTFNNDVHINASKGGVINIGVSCLIGPGVMLFTANHTYSDTASFIREQGDDIGDIIIGDDCWLGANSIITSGVRIGKGSIVGAGSVVTKDIGDYVVAAGVPARVIKQRGKVVE